MNISPAAAREILQNSDVLFTSDAVQAGLHQVAADINASLSNQHPLVLAVMGGALVFAGQLLPLLNFPLDFDYVHVSRYGDARHGGTMKWKVEPGENVRGRVVLLLDDILDEGHTLHALHERVMALGATRCMSAVFADKQHGRAKPIHADFVGINVPNRFVFGYGMDVQGAWRNLPAIYAVNEGELVAGSE